MTHRPTTLPGTFAAARFRRFAAVAALAAAGGCNRHAGGPPMGGMPPGMPVMTAAAEQQVVPLYLDEIGNAAANNAVTITPQVAGTITEVHFADGADVKKGQVLFVIDPRPYQAALDQAAATLKADQASLAYAKQDLSFYQGLTGTNAVSAETYAAKQNAVAVADAKLAESTAAVETAKIDLDYCTVRSPLDGRAGRRLVDPGNVVKANEGSLVSIQALDPMYAYFTVTENELPRVRQYVAGGTLECHVRLPSDDSHDATSAAPEPAPASSEGRGAGSPAKQSPVSTGDQGAASVASASAQPAPAAPTGDQSAAPVAAASSQPAPEMGSTPLPPGGRIGQLTFLDNAVQDGSGTVKLRATIPNADHHFWPGQFVNVRLILANRPAVLVPATAPQVSQQGLFVYKVQPDDKSPTKFAAMQQPVTVGQRHGDLVAIDSGLSPGDQVVTSGQMLLQPGAAVMVVNTAPPGGKEPPAPPKVGPGTLKSPDSEGQPKAGPAASATSAASAGGAKESAS